MPYYWHIELKIVKRLACVKATIRQTDKPIPNVVTSESHLTSKAPFR